MTYATSDEETPQSQQEKKDYVNSPIEAPSLPVLPTSEDETKNSFRLKLPNLKRRPLFSLLPLESQEDEFHIPSLCDGHTTKKDEEDEENQDCNKKEGICSICIEEYGESLIKFLNDLLFCCILCSIKSLLFFHH